MGGYGEVGERLRLSSPTGPPDTVTIVVHRNHARFDGRPVRDFVPLFVERGANKELARLGFGWPRSEPPIQPCEKPFQLKHLVLPVADFRPGSCGGAVT